MDPSQAFASILRAGTADFFAAGPLPGPPASHPCTIEPSDYLDRYADTLDVKLLSNLKAIGATSARREHGLEPKITAGSVPTRDVVAAFLFVALGVNWATRAMGVVRRHIGLLNPIGAAILAVLGLLMISVIWGQWIRSVQKLVASCVTVA